MPRAFAAEVASIYNDISTLRVNASVRLIISITTDSVMPAVNRHLSTSKRAHCDIVASVTAIDRTISIDCKISGSLNCYNILLFD